MSEQLCHGSTQDFFQYLTPYSDPSMNREPEPVECSDWEFYHAEKTIFGE